MTKTLSGLVLATMLLSGCATAPVNSTTVIQRENNQFEVIGLGKTKTLAMNNAVNSANKFCKNKNTIVASEQVKYNGVVEEKTGRMIDQAAGVIGVLMGGKTPTVSRDDDYEVALKFYCQ
jgi:PBP1b-binding outer membrane lipoprotein LpoB